jgi:hypothetical protein
LFWPGGPVCTWFLSPLPHPGFVLSDGWGVGWGGVGVVVGGVVVGVVVGGGV